MKKAFRLYWQQLPGYVALVLAATAVAGSIACAGLRQLYHDQKQESLEQQARLLFEPFERVLMAPDTAAVDRWCKAVGRRSAARVTAILPSGKVIGDSDENPAQMDYHNRRPEVLEALAGRVGVSDRYSRTLMQPMIYVALPLSTDGQVRAVLRTSAPMANLETLLGEMWWKLGAAGFLLVLLAAVVCILAAGSIRRRLENLQKGVETFAEDPAAARLLPEGPAEVSALAEALNRLAERSAGRIEAVGRERIAYEALAGQRNAYEAVLSSMVEGVVAVDLDERVLDMNPAAVDMLQIDPVRLKGRSISEAVRNSRFQRFVTEALERGDAVGGDVELQHGRGGVIHLQCAPLRDSAGMRIGTLLVLNDVTQVRRLENVRQDFVANASHEIKTPLTAIKGFVETLAGGALHRPGEAERFLKIISNHVNRLEAILEDLLALARLEQAQGADELQMQQRPLGDLVRTAVQFVQEAADEKQIRIDIAVDEALSVAVDAPLFEQALVNLVDNAVKYSPPGSTVTVRAAGSADEVAVQVVDHGPGIAKKHQPRLFERFYRVDTARSRQLGGTGLGLAIVKHILQAHGGRVSLESIPGRGSVFTLHLPHSVPEQ